MTFGVSQGRCCVRRMRIVQRLIQDHSHYENHFHVKCGLTLESLPERLQWVHSLHRRNCYCNCLCFGGYQILQVVVMESTT